MSQAAVCILDSCAPEEYALTVDPKQSFFNTRFHQCTKYAKQLTVLQLFGNQAFGENIYVPLSRNDMIGRLYVILTIPGIRHKDERVHKPRSTSNCRFGNSESEYSSSSSSSSSSSPSDRHDRRRRNKHDKYDSSSDSSDSKDDRHDKVMKFDKSRPHVVWADSFAHVAMKSLEFHVANIPVTVHSGEHLDIEDHYTTKPGAPTDETVGRYHVDEALWLASRMTQRRVVRARFHFCENIGKALPAFAIRKSTMRVVIQLRDLSECYFSSDNSRPYVIDKNEELSDKHIKVEVAANVYHLTRPERAQIFATDHAILMHQVQEMVVPLDNKADRAANHHHSIKLNFKHPVVELKYVIQRDKHLFNKDWFNYSGLNREDPLEAMNITINGKELFPMWPGKWWRTIEPMEHHINIPNKHIYSLSFAIAPDDETYHSGYFNFTAIDDVTIHLLLQRNIGHVCFKCWAKTINIFRIEKSEVGLGWM